MSRSRFLPLIALLALVLVMGVPPCPAAQPTLTLPEQEVIEALLQQSFRAESGQKLVVQEQLSAQGVGSSNNYEKMSQSLRNEVKQRGKAIQEALEDYLQKNRTPTKCVFPTNAPKRVELVSSNVVHEIFSGNARGKKPDGWELFYQRFPGATGLITLSRVGIDPKGTVAIVYMGQQSHWLAGGGGIRVLRREGSKWVLTNISIGPQWIS